MKETLTPKIKIEKNHYIMKKGLIKQEDVISIDIKHNIRTLKNVRQILIDLMGEIDYNAIILEYFKSTVSTMDGSSQKCPQRHRN